MFPNLRITRRGSRNAKTSSVGGSGFSGCGLHVLSHFGCWLWHSGFILLNKLVDLPELPRPSCVVEELPQVVSIVFGRIILSFKTCRLVVLRTEFMLKVFPCFHMTTRPNYCKLSSNLPFYVISGWADTRKHTRITGDNAKYSIPLCTTS